MATNRVVSGAQVILFVNGVQFGNVRSFTFKPSNISKRIMTLDTHIANELIPTILIVSGQIQLYRINNDGGAEGKQLAPPPTNITRARYVSLLLQNRISQETIFRTDTAMITEQTWAVGTSQLMIGSLSFESLEWTSLGIENNLD
jgi:hypothetical protein